MEATEWEKDEIAVWVRSNVTPRVFSQMNPFYNQRILEHLFIHKRNIQCLQPYDPLMSSTSIAYDLS